MTEDTFNSLFSQDDLDAMEASQISSRPSGPVTVLGITFDNDEARRAYFREELRKRLPELRIMDGFPLAEDKDIIALSDPPYYTACPNPWLDDFVSEWEKEKEKLTKEGKRVEGVVVSEPYASDVSEGKNNPVYNAHSYHTKVPHPAIMRYILHYTEPGDIILDGFCGTGMAGVAARMCAKPDAETKNKITEEYKSFNKKIKWGLRHAICGDLSPYASFISSIYNVGFDYRAFKKEAQRIISQVEKDCAWMYKTHHPATGEEATINYTVYSDVLVCPSCGNEYVFWDEAVDKDAGEIRDSFHCPHCGAEVSKKNSPVAFESYYDNVLNEIVSRAKVVPVIINYETASGKRYEKSPDPEDFDLIAKINDFKVEEWCPTDLLPEGYNTTQPINRHITNTHQFFTNRNLICLSHFYNLCKDSKFYILLSGIMSDTSKMSRMKIGYYFHGGGGPYIPGLNGTLYIPSLSVEKRVSFAIPNRLDSLWRAFVYMGSEVDSAVYTGSATSIHLKDNSIDYIFTDPPFGGNLMYSELNFLVESWLKVKTNNTPEAIQNPVQKKGLFEYQSLMQACFAEYYRVLKPNKWLTIEFSNTSASVWNSIQNALQSVGFVVANVSALDKKQGSFKAVTTTTAVKQDLVITCFKPSDEVRERINASSDEVSSLWDFIDEYLRHLPISIEKGKATTTVIERSPKILFDRLISYYVQKGLPVPINASEFQTGLRERFEECDGMFFTVSQLNEYLEKKKSAPEFVPMGLIVANEADGIEWLRNHLRERPLTYQQISPEWMQAINGIRKGDILPELQELLEENFIQEADGSWRLPNVQDDVDKDRLRAKALLKEFKTYVEAASKPKAKIKEVRVEAIRAGFKQCYMDKDFATIVLVGEKIPQNLLTEDEILLQFYDIAVSHM